MVMFQLWHWGGRASNKNMQVVDAKTYINIIGQAVGKIIDLSE